MTPIIPDKIIILNSEPTANTVAQISRDRIAAIRNERVKTLPMIPSITFMDLAVQGRFANPNKEIYDYIDAWHKSNLAPPLHKWLGMTWDEYVLYVQDANSLSVIIATKRRIGLADTQPMEAFVSIYLPITFDEQYMIRTSNYSKLPKIFGMFITPSTIEADAKSRAIKTSNIGFIAKFNVKTEFMDAYNFYLDTYSIPTTDIEKLNANIIGNIELITVN